MEAIYFILIGAAGGVLAGMGMGGGTLLIPMLTLIMHLSQHDSQMLNLVSFIPMAIVALVIHFKNKLVDLKVALPLLISGLAGAFLGAKVANQTQADSLRLWFGIFLSLLGAFSLFHIFLSKKRREQQSPNAKN